MKFFNIYTSKNQVKLISIFLISIFSLALTAFGQEPIKKKVVSQNKAAAKSIGAMPNQKDKPLELSDTQKTGVSKIYFEENQGQFGAEAYFRAYQGNDYFDFNSSKITVVQQDKDLSKTHDWSMSFAHSAAVKPSANMANSFKINNYTGSVKQENIKSFKEVLYANIYQNIDLKYYENKNQFLEYDFIVQPKGRVSDIVVDFSNVKNLKVEADNKLSFETPFGKIENTKPYAYQIIDKKEIEVPVQYVVDGSHMSFEVLGAYDTSLPLVIDPMVLNYTAELDRNTQYIIDGKNLYYYSKSGVLKGIDRNGNIIYATTLPANLTVVDFRVDAGKASVIFQNPTSATSAVSINGTSVPKDSSYVARFSTAGAITNGFMTGARLYYDYVSLSENKFYKVSAATANLFTTPGAAFSSIGTNQGYMTVRDKNGVLLAATYVPYSGSIFHADDQKVYFGDVQGSNFYPNNELIHKLSSDGTTYTASQPLGLAGVELFYGSESWGFGFVNNVIVGLHSGSLSADGSNYSYEGFAMLDENLNIIHYDSPRLYNSNNEVLSDGSISSVNNTLNIHSIYKTDGSIVNLQRPINYSQYEMDLLDDEIVVATRVSGANTSTTTFDPITCTTATTNTLIPDKLWIYCFDKNTGALKNSSVFSEIKEGYPLAVKYDSLHRIHLIVGSDVVNANLDCALPITLGTNTRQTFYARLKCDGRVDYLTALDNASPGFQTPVLRNAGNDIFMFFNDSYTSTLPRTPNNINDVSPTTTANNKSLFLHFIEPVYTGINAISPNNQQVCLKEKPQTIHDNGCTLNYTHPQTSVTIRGVTLPYLPCGTPRKCFQWQKSLNNTTWTDIEGAIDSVYTPDVLTQTTYFRRMLFDIPSNVHTLTVRPFTAPKIDVTPKVFCVAQTVVLNPTITGSSPFTYLWSPATGLSSATIANPVATPTVSSSYKVVVTDVNGCVTEAYQALNELKVNVGSDKTICNGTDSQLSASLSVQGGGPFTYQWSVVSGDMSSIISGSTTLNPVIKPNTITIYRLTVTGPNGCVVTDDISITAQDPLTNAPINIVACGTNTILRLPPTCYEWSITPRAGSHPSYINGLTVRGDSLYHDGQYAANCGQTTYSLKVVDKKGVCPNVEKQITVRALTKLSGSYGCGNNTIGNPDNSCGTNTYTWSVVSGDMASIPAGQGSGSQISPTPSVATVYKRTVTNGTDVCESTSTMSPCAALSCPTLPNRLLKCNVYPTSFRLYPKSDDISYTVSLVSADPGLVVSADTMVMVNAGFVGTKTISLLYKNKLTGATVCTINYTVTAPSADLKTTVFNQEIDCKVGKVIGGTPKLGYLYRWTNQSITSGQDFLDDSTKLDAIASPLKTTNYQLYVKHLATGCDTTYRVTVTVKTLNFAEGTNTFCITSPPASIGTPANASFAYEWSPATNLSSTNVVRPTFTPTVIGMFKYVVKVTDIVTGCVAIDTARVNVGASPTANAGPDVTFCKASLASRTIGVLPVAGVSYTWTPIKGLSDPNIANPTLTSDAITGTYKVVASVGECTTNDEVLVTVTPVAKSVQVLADAIACGFNPTTIGKPAVAGKIYLWKASPEFTDLTNPNPSVLVFASASFILVETDTVNCTEVTYTQQVNTVEEDTDRLAGSDATVCTPSTVVIGIAAKTSYTYSWSPTTGLSNSAIAQPTLTPTGTTAVNYTLTYNKQGCDFTDIVSVTPKSTPAPAVAGSNATACEGIPVSIGGGTAISGITYSWTPTDGLSSSTIRNPTASPTVTTTYSVVAKNGVCESAASTVVVTVNNLSATMPASYTVCLGKSIVIGPAAVPNHTYAWTGSGLSANNIAQPTVTVTANTSYSLVVTNTANGCSKTLTTAITVATVPAISVGSDLIACQNGCVTVVPTYGNGFTSFVWNPATGVQNSQSAITQICPTEGGGLYTLTAKTADGCIAMTNLVVSVSISPAPIANAGEDKLICLGKTVQLTTLSDSDYNYLWQEFKNNNWITATSLSNPNIHNPTASPTANTSYKVIVTNKNTGCVSEDIVKVTTQILSVSITASASICIGSAVSYSTTITSTPNIADTDLTYLWTPSIGLSSAAIKRPIITPTSNTIYSVIVTDSISGCVTKSNDLVVTVENAPKPSVADIAKVYLLCDADSLVLPISPVATYTYLLRRLTPNRTFSINAKLPAGNYFLTITNTLATVCTKTNAKNLTIVKLTPPVVNLPTKAVCKGTTTPVMIGDTAIDLKRYNIVWLNTTAMTNVTSKTPTVLPSTTTIYRIRLTPKSSADSVYVGNCGFEFSQTVEVRDLPIAFAGDDRALCSPGTLKLGAGTIPNYSYLWTNGIDTVSTAAEPAFFINGSVNYKLSLKDELGCQSTDNVFLSIGSPTLKDTTLLCVNDNLQTSVQLSGTPSGGVWSAKAGNPAAATITTAGAVTGMTVVGVYKFIYTVSSGTETCTDTADVTVKACPVCTKPNAGSDQTLACANPATGALTTSATLTGFSPAGGTWAAQTGNPAAATVSATGAVSGMSIAGSYKFIYSVSLGGQTCTDTVQLTTVACPVLKGSIGDYVFLDTDNSKAQSVGDTPIDGVKVYLLSAAGVKRDSTTTASGGKYLFPNLVAGTYSIQFVAPVGQVFVTQDSGADELDSDAGTDGKTGTYVIDTTKPVGDPARDITSVDAGIKNSCNLIDGGLTVSIDQKGTSSTADDDYVIYANPTGTGLAATYNVSGDITKTGVAYGTTVEIGRVSTANSVISYVIEDAADANCSIADAFFNLSSNTCILKANPTVLCNDNGTPSNPSDDTFSVSLNPTGNGISATYNVTGGITASNIAYGSAQQIATGLLISVGGVTITVRDATTANCELINIRIDPPAACSGNGVAKLDLVKTVDKPQAKVGEDVTYTIVVRNTGTASSNAIEVTDTLNSNLQFVSASPAAAYNSTTGLWTIGVLPVGGSATLTIVAKLLGIGVTQNYADITLGGNNDSDGPLNNHDVVCTTVPIELCTGTTFTLTIPSNFTDIQWFKDGVAIAGATSSDLLVNAVGDYTFTTKETANGCPASGCCPIRVIAGTNCCPAKICLPVKLKRN